MPLTELGFKRRTYNEILNDKITTAKELFGEDIETSELTPFGKFLRINAYDQAVTEEEAEMIYYSIFPNTAIGTSLDRLCVFAGITRNAATSAQYVVEIKGKAGTVIPENCLVKTESDINYLIVGKATVDTDYEGNVTNITTLEGEVIIDASGIVLATVECCETGEIGNVLPAQINSLVEQLADIESVNGQLLIVKGEEIESDYELRERFSAAREGLGACNEDALVASLLRVPTVTHAGVIVNDTDETDSDNRPPRSFECFVTGGENYFAEIAKAIYEKKSIGIKTHGDISETVIDEGGTSHTIYFSQTEFIDAAVEIFINTNEEFEGDAGNQEIKGNLETYIDSLDNGETLVLTTLYGYIYKVKGVENVTGLSLNKSTKDISTAKNQKIRFTTLTVNGKVIS